MDEFSSRLYAELKSYAPVALPALFIYVLESDASLKLWHAVQRTPYLGAEGILNEPNVEDVARIAPTHKAVKKTVRRERFGNIAVSLILFSIVLVEQYNSVMNRLDEEGEDEDSVVYYNAYFGSFGRAEYYYAVTLFLPAFFLIARAIKLLSGMGTRIAFRDSKGAPFMVIANTNNVALGFILLNLAVSALLAAGALWVRNSVCIAVFYASIVHFWASNNIVTKTASFKQRITGELFMTLCLASLFGMRDVSNDEELTRFPFFNMFTGVNWGVLIISSIWSIAPLSFMSLCYRFDYDIARPNVPPIDLPVVEGAIPGAPQVRGTVVEYALCSTSARPRFAKPYFHAALGGYLAGNMALAMLTVAGYIECSYEWTSMYLVVVALPTMTAPVLAVAAARGEVNRLWAYQEEWTRAQKTRTVSNVDAGSGDLNRDLEAKQLLLFANEKTGCV
ncbi:hypothetical protein DFH11DRAFT_1728228 [Phellopilus nigrolimitatus]|nr:hypothetical protein DFH11DRAFT_1728228 [Phellopilus nigrolimitatus]